MGCLCRGTWCGISINWSRERRQFWDSLNGDSRIRTDVLRSHSKYRSSIKRNPRVLGTGLAEN